MKTILLLKDFYSAAFEKLKNIEVYLMKALTWFSLGVLGIAFFAFIYRVVTGFFMI